MTTISVTFVEESGAVKALDGVKTGQSLMEVARANNVEGILADCGGACACATCHVYVDPVWAEKVGKADSIEAEMLDMAAEPRDTSRLSCQIQLTDDLDGLKVEVAPAF